MNIDKLDNLTICEKSKNNQRVKMVKEFNKSLSNVSTTSVESGICDMYSSDDYDCEESNATICETEINKMTLGEAVKRILVESNDSGRLICGLNKVSEYLNSTEFLEHSLFFFIAPSAKSDSLVHMQEVVLQSFCFENDIYIIKVDSAEKLNKIIDSNRCDTCALVQRSAVCDLKSVDDPIDIDKFTELENILIDHCEDFWSEPVQPIVKLPEK